jgi:hypothetical protein
MLQKEIHHLQELKICMFQSIYYQGFYYCTLFPVTNIEGDVIGGDIQPKILKVNSLRYDEER